MAIAKLFVLNANAIRFKAKIKRNKEMLLSPFNHYSYAVTKKKESKRKCCRY